MTMPSRGQVDRVIRERLDEDPAFRERLLRDPKGTLASVFSIDVPEGMEVFVHEDTPSEVHLVIPGSAELSDRDLEMVSGGACWTDCPQDYGP